MRRLVGPVLTTMVAVLVTVAPVHAQSPPTPGIKINDETSFCTSAFTAQGNDGNYYLMTSAHCDAHDGSVWTYGDNQAPLGKLVKGEYAENPETGTQTKDAALIKLEPGVGVPSDDIAGKYPVRDALSLSQIKVGTQMCKVGAVTGETCGPITDIEGDYVVEAKLHCTGGDSGSPGFVRNPDGTASAIGILTSASDDENTTYFILVAPLLTKWGLRLLT
ncbi:trypsin [Mycobacterium sp. 1100029.7]|nr:trypsin [Mycobacterium sp. 1100029.7]